MRRNVRVALLGASFLVLPAIMIGCDGGGGDDFGEYGGEVQLLKIRIGTSPLATGSAVFYSDYVPATGETMPGENPYSALPIDTCVTNDSATVGTDGTYTTVNVGSEVRLVGDAGTLVLTMTTAGSFTFYESETPGAGSNFPDASFADVEWDNPATTLADAISVPPALTVTAPDPSLQVVTVPTNGNMTFTWTTVGSEEILIAFLTFPGGICRVNDDGTFDVPTSFLSAINTTSGIVGIIAADFGFENVDFGAGERSVVTMGANGQVWQY